MPINVIAAKKPEVMDLSIQGISQFGGLYQAYPARQIPVVSVEAVRGQQQNTIADSSASLTSVQEAPEQQEQKASRKADLQNLSLTFNTGDDYGYIGKDSALEKLDVMQAVSDMQKDAVLQQYQTFVGGNDTVFSSDDGVVLMK